MIWKRRSGSRLRELTEIACNAKATCTKDPQTSQQFPFRVWVGEVGNYFLREMLPPLILITFDWSNPSTGPKKKEILRSWESTWRYYDVILKFLISTKYYTRKYDIFWYIHKNDKIIFSLSSVQLANMFYPNTTKNNFRIKLLQFYLYCTKAKPKWNKWKQ